MLSLGDGPLMHMVRLARDVGPPGREQELRDFLGSFRFVGEMVTQPVGTLSGGEKARLVLAMLVWQRPNLLLLDEPTNHLDLTTREALSMALNEFEGTVMLVSHDRALLREVCDEFWLVADGVVKPFDGDLDDYQRWLLEQSRAASREQSRSDKAKKQGGTEGVARGGRVEGSAPASRLHPGRRPLAAGTASVGPGPPPAAQCRRPEVRGTIARPPPQCASSAPTRPGPLRKELNLVDNRLGVLFAERDAIEAALRRRHPHAGWRWPKAASA